MYFLYILIIIIADRSRILGQYLELREKHGLSVYRLVAIPEHFKTREQRVSS